jgi:t-SNARE complex subunit (syntaxin)
MPTLRVEAQVSSDELLKAVSHLSLPELEKFVSQIIRLQARLKAPSIPHEEAELLLRINQGIPPGVRQRYSELISKRRSESLSIEEHSELLGLTEQVEKSEAQRVKCLSELARIRKTTLSELMNALGIRTPDYA